MKKILMGLAFSALALIGCAGTSDDPEALDNALVGFTSCVQGSRWQEALDYVTPDEANQISPDGYEFKQEYQIAARRLPLSTLRKAGLQVDGRGRLVGIKAAMDEANERYVVSEEQAKVGTNLEERKRSISSSALKKARRICRKKNRKPSRNSRSKCSPTS